MSVFKTRKQREAEEAAARAAQEKEKNSLKNKLASIKVSDAVAGMGAVAAGVGAVFTTIGIVKSTCAAPAETPEEACASKILQWLLDMPGLTPDSDVWDLAWKSKFLMGARWDKKTTVCKMVETRWPEMAAAQAQFIAKHTAPTQTPATTTEANEPKNKNNGRRNKSGRK